MPSPVRAYGTPLEPPQQVNPKISDRVNQAIPSPAQELQMIDRLWRESSCDRFGLSVQKRIWQTVVGMAKTEWKAWCCFGDTIGWRMKGNWLAHSSLNFTPQAPEGELPALVVCDSFTLRYQESVVSLLSRQDL